MTSRQYLTYRQAAEKTGTSERLIWQLVRDGVLPHVKFGRCVRIPSDKLDAWADAQMEGASTDAR